METLLSMQAGRPRRAVLAALALAALMIHGLVFSGLESLWPAPAAGLPSEGVALRVVEVSAAMMGVEAQAEQTAPAPVVKEHADAVTVPVPAASRRREVVRSPATIPAAPPASPVTAAPSALTGAGVPSATMIATSPLASQTDAVASSAAGATSSMMAELEALPRYRTELPPAFEQRYALWRGASRGDATLTWRPQGDHYELQLDGQIDGAALLTQISRGDFDGAGLAPLRYTDQRARRGVRATNFQRGSGKITFSGPTIEFPLHDGTQDRLSWMVQLAAIVSAEPGLRVAGARIAIPVVGVSGDLSLWAFDASGVESITTDAGVVSAFKCVREPSGPYDTRVQVWLDPARHCLPVRATQQSGPNDAGWDLRLTTAE